MAAVGIGIAALVFLLWSVLDRGLPAFSQTFIRADITLDPAVLDPKGNRDPEEMKKVLTFAYGKIIKDSLGELSAELQASGAPGITPALLAGMISEARPGPAPQLRPRQPGARSARRSSSSSWRAGASTSTSRATSPARARPATPASTPHSSTPPTSS